MQLIYFAVTLFVSAFLLFLVQPMIGKMILPRLGGTPQVWNTCCMFFQTVLLCGYAYTHNVTSKLPVRKQLAVHGAALLLPMFVLFIPALLFGRPLYVGDFGAEGGGNPILMTLFLLALVVGIPFLIVSTTAPLLQRWFASTGDPAAKDPYFLYGASNAGSILGLLLYPVLVERLLGLSEQAWFWSLGYVVLAGLVAGCAFIVLRAPATVQLPGLATEEPPPPIAPEAVATSPAVVKSTHVTATPPAAVPRQTGIRRGGKQRGARGRGAAPLPRTPAVPTPAAAAKVTHAPAAAAPPKPFEMTPLRRIRWVGLAAVPSSMMLGVTSYISTDISPIPLLWVIPLTLYLLSFVCVFSRWPVPWVGQGIRDPKITPHKVCLFLQPIGFAIVMYVIMTSGYSKPMMAMTFCWAGFFLTALVCHGELAADRPPARYLTEFYLWMSVGGMVGGTFNALIAPLVPWWGLFEFPLVIVFAGILRPSFPGEGWTDTLLGAYQSPSGESISQILDYVLPILVLAVSYFLISQSMSPENWNLSPRRLIDPSTTRQEAAMQEEVAKRNNMHPLYRFANKTIGLGAQMAYYFASGMYLLITFGVGIGCALAAWKRPIRMGLGLGAVLLANAFFEARADDNVLYRDRSYFGILRVMKEEEWFYAQTKEKTQEKTKLAYRANYLMHGTTHHGLNYQEPPDMRRLATTYYHGDGPVGAVMAKLNWFPGQAYVDPANPKAIVADDRLTYWGDARLPISVIGSAAPAFGINLPLAQLVSAWSEPPYATIGLGTGTMASYGRPYQHVTFYEIDQHIRNFSLPPDAGEPFFNYLQGALKRGCKLEVIMGDARLMMAKKTPNENASYYIPSWPVPKGLGVNTQNFTSAADRESYYRVIEVDAFSSDAIPVHLITKEAIELYMSKLTPDGVLCVHTSNRHVNLVQPVVRICEDATWKDWLDRNADGTPKIKSGLAWTICKDGGAEQNRNFSTEEPSRSGHFGSEYVLVARKQEYLPPYKLQDLPPFYHLEPKGKEGKEGAVVDFLKKKISREVNVTGPTGAKEKKTMDVVMRPIVWDLAQIKALEEQKIPIHPTTIDFYTPASLNSDDQRIIMQRYEYIVPAGTREWTDDYSNVLSVFRWR